MEQCVPYSVRDDANCAREIIPQCIALNWLYFYIIKSAGVPIGIPDGGLVASGYDPGGR